jgi:hypothetical protein
MAGLAGVSRGGSVLVVVVAVLCVAVAIMKVVHVVAVLHSLMHAVTTAVHVLGESVFCLDFFGHDYSFGAQSVGLTAVMWFPTVGDGVTDDVGHVFIGQGVKGIPACARDCDQVVSPQHFQVLGNQRLGESGLLYQSADG